MIASCLSYDLNRSLVVQASAGTGKTTALVNRIVDVIAAGSTVDKIAPAAREDACRHCEYLPVCGPYEEERVKEHKSQAELKALKELRTWR